MFSGGTKDRNKKENPANGNLLNIIGNETRLTGDLESSGDIRVDGSIEGHVTVKQRFVLGEAGVVKGDVDAKDAIIAGNLHGNIRVDNTLVLKPSARIDGDIITDKIIIESGAQFNGRCSMNVQLSTNPAPKASANILTRAKAQAD